MSLGEWVQVCAYIYRCVSMLVQVRKRVGVCGCKGVPLRLCVWVRVCGRVGACVRMSVGVGVREGVCARAQECGRECE